MLYKPSRFFWLLTVTLLITTGLWLGANQDILLTPRLWPWRGPSQLAALWSASLVALALLAIVRSSSMEFLFGGLDQAVLLHRKLGLAALLTQVVHAILLTVHFVSHDIPIALSLQPSTSNERTPDILVLYALIALGALAYDRRLQYEHWIKLHRVIGALFIGGTLHAGLSNGVIHHFEPLRTWIVILLIISLGAWLYQVMLFRKFGPRYQYQVVSVTQRSKDIVDVTMRPTAKRMMYLPGTFVFISAPSFKGKSSQLHPFSLSSTPTERDLRVSCKQVGDFTKQLLELHPANANDTKLVDVYGPFGNFTPHRFAPYRRMIWIGAGIGITPFLSMVAFERTNHDFRRVWLYYSVRTREDGIYDAELKDNIERADSLIDYTLWVSSTQGRLTAAKIVADIELDDYAVMLCGTKAFVAGMAAEFRSLGLASERIITEELQFR
jgi:predicted ferric reductase